MTKRELLKTIENIMKQKFYIFDNKENQARKMDVTGFYVNFEKSDSAIYDNNDVEFDFCDVHLSQDECVDAEIAKLKKLKIR